MYVFLHTFERYVFIAFNALFLENLTILPIVANSDNKKGFHGIFETYQWKTWHDRVKC
jgi:hypothetical protein